MRRIDRDITKNELPLPVAIGVAPQPEAISAASKEMSDGEVTSVVDNWQDTFLKEEDGWTVPSPD
jgi:hypothetical protein